MTGSARSHPQWEILKQIYSRRLFRRELFFVLASAALMNLALYYFLTQSYIFASWLVNGLWPLYALYAIDFFLITLVFVTADSIGRLRDNNFFHDLYMANIPWKVALGALVRGLGILMLFDLALELPIRTLISEEKAVQRWVEFGVAVVLGLAGLAASSCLLVMLNVLLPVRKRGTLALHLAAAWGFYVLIITAVSFLYDGLMWVATRYVTGKPDAWLNKRYSAYFAQIGSAAILSMVLVAAAFIFYRLAVKHGDRLLTD